MLKQLKYKFILTNMALVGAILFILFAAISFFTANATYRDIRRSLDTMVQFEGDGGTPPDQKPPQNNIGGALINPDGEKLLLSLYVFSVTVDHSGAITDSYSFGYEPEESFCRQAVEAALKDDHIDGKLSSLGLFYRIKQIKDGTRIAFASTDYLYTTVRHTTLITGSVCLIALCIFYGICHLLARIVIRPVEEAWNKQKDFIADASHELKTPLTVVLANTDILNSRKDATVAEQWHWIESTKNEAARMRELVDRMLELASSENISDTIERSAVDLSSLVERAALQFEPLAFEGEMRIDTKIDPDIQIRSHEDSVLRILAILLDNAIKYNDPGKNIELTLIRNSHTATLSVRSFGAVIPKEALPRIFERFYRTDRSRSTGGYGLGLAIAKQLTENIGAKIRAESAEQTGTAFIVVFDL